VAHTSARGVNEHALARSDLRDVRQTLPRGEPGQRQRRGPHVIERRGLSRELAVTARPRIRRNPLPARGKKGIPNTSSPTLNRFTPGTTSSTTPEMSQPRMKGGFKSGNAPERT